MPVGKRYEGVQSAMTSKRVQTPLVCHGHERPIVELSFRCIPGATAGPVYFELA